MRVVWANIEDVWREAAARWTLITYFILSTIFIVIFASAVNLDIVDGALAGARLFGKDVEMRGGGIGIEQLVMYSELVFSIIIYGFSVLLAVFATAHLVPRMQEKGTVDLYLSRPVSRPALLLSRYVAGLLLAASNVVYLTGAIWFIVAWKTHIFNPRFLLSGVIMMFVIAALLAFAFLVGTITSSTAVSIMSSYALCLMSIFLSIVHGRIDAVFSHDWLAAVVDGLYWIVPKAWELGGSVAAYVTGPISHMKIPAPGLSAFVSTGMFGITCLVLAVWRFQKKEF